MRVLKTFVALEPSQAQHDNYWLMSKSDSVLSNIRILFLASTPDGANTLQTGAELREMESALKNAKNGEIFELIDKPHVHLDDLNRLLIQYQPQIVHFSGHGTQFGELLFANNDSILPQILSNIFRSFQDTVRCVVLNSCYSDRPALAIAEYIDCVLGIPGEIEDRDAIVFAKEFYFALASNYTVIQAWEIGTNRLTSQNLPNKPIGSRDPSKIYAREWLSQTVNDSQEDDDWSIVWQEYCRNLTNLHGTIPVLCHSDSVNNVVNIREIYTDLDVYKKASTVFRRVVDHSQNLTSGYTDRLQNGVERINAWERVKQGDNLSIVGKPGAGKTTLLQHIVIKATEQTEVEYVPIYISLHQWVIDRRESIKQFIDKQFDACGAKNSNELVNELLRSKKTLVLFDGLDEVNKEGNQRDELLNLIWSFVSQYPRVQYIIAGRILPPSHMIRPPFASTEIADFTDVQIYSYISGWLQDEQLAQNVIDELKKPANRSVKELCRVPLHLSLLCCAFLPGKPLPQSRAQLYHDAVEHLLSEWDSKKRIQRDVIYHGFQNEKKLHFLSELAAQTFNEAIYHFEKDWLSQQIATYFSTFPGAPSSQWINPTKVLEEIIVQHGILMKRSSGSYSFSHRTFHEYFTALYIIDHEDSTKPIQLVREHLTDARWREVFLFVAGLLKETVHDTRQFFNVFLAEINSLVTSEPYVQELLSWAEQEAHKQHQSTQLKIFELRLLYILMARAYLDGGYLAHGLSIDLEYATETAYYLDFVEDLSFMVGVLRDRDIPIPLIIRPLEPAERTQPPGLFDIDLPFDCESIQTLAFKTNPQTALTFGLIYAHQLARIFADAGISDGDEEDIRTLNIMRQHVPSYVQYVKSLMGIAEATKIEACIRSLHELQIPSADDPRAAWRLFEKVLYELIPFELPASKRWRFEESHFSSFNAYLQANELLMQCLEGTESRHSLSVVDRLFSVT